MNDILKTERENKGFTQEDLARAADLKHLSYSRMERGLQEPTISQAYRIAAAVDKPLEYVFPPSLYQKAG